MSRRLRATAAAALGVLALGACGSATVAGGSAPKATPTSQATAGPSPAASAHAGRAGILGSAPTAAKTVAVSMGDSFISGEGASLVGNMYDSNKKDAAGMSAANYRSGLYTDMWGKPIPADATGWLCHRSTVAEIRSAQLPNTDLTANLACSGAVSADVLTSDYNGLPPQIKQLEQLAHDSKYKITTVVLSIGGNDLEFSKVIKHCVQVLQHNLCGQEEENDTYFTPAIRNKVLTRVVNTVTQIRRTLTSNGYAPDSYRFVLQSYPSIFAPASQRRNVSTDKFAECPGTGLSNETVNWADSYVTPWINGLVRDAAQQTDVTFLDLSRALNGHTMCDVNTDFIKDKSGARPASASRAEWVAALLPWPARTAVIDGLSWLSPGRWFESTSVTNTLKGRENESFHPNYYGQQALGACLRKAVASGAKSAACVGAPNADPEDVTVTTS
jgi:hypothetical protein